MDSRFTIIFLLVFNLWAQVDWTKEATLPIEGHRKNIYGWNEAELTHKIREGKLHALYYPVTVSGLFIPYSPFRQMFEMPASNPFKKTIFKLLKEFSDFNSTEEIWSWLGLHDYPQSEGDKPVYYVPFRDGKRPEDPMGLTLKDHHGVEVLTFSCAACHVGDLFGTKVLGLTNRFPRANELFHKSKKALRPVPGTLYKSLFAADEAEVKQFLKVKENLQYIGVKKPIVLGLDTSLAQVALSLAKRGEDEIATKDPKYAKWPRKNALENFPADSKPMVWWNLKYKTRWLSDGSILSGNPILTNFLWNEIGRGVDLNKLEIWIEENQEIINELTTAVFATEAPEYLDFFPSIDVAKAKRGEKHFQNLCQRCHGKYIKNWSRPDSDPSDMKSYVATSKVHYKKRTRAIDVGTDPHRHQGMQYFAKDLNRLKLSKRFGIEVVPQKGYIPPPLVGIWARWPYFHNNSAPNLCSLLSPANERPRNYMASKVATQNDYDQDCVGYPLKTKQGLFKFDTKVKGLSNSGHDKGIFIKNGKNLLLGDKRGELIEFLKTL